MKVHQILELVPWDQTDKQTIIDILNNPDDERCNSIKIMLWELYDTLLASRFNTNVQRAREENLQKENPLPVDQEFLVNVRKQTIKELETEVVSVSEKGEIDILRNQIAELKKAVDSKHN